MSVKPTIGAKSFLTSSNELNIVIGFGKHNRGNSKMSSPLLAISIEIVFLKYL